MTKRLVNNKTKRQQDILDVAARLFSLRGFDGTSMSEIANGSGMLKGSLYYYFKSKRDLAVKVIGGYLEESIGNLGKILDLESSYTEKLQLAIHSHITFFGDNLPFTSFAYDHDHVYLHPMTRKQINRTRDEYEKLWRRLISEGIRSGEFRAGLDEAMVARGILGMCNWMGKWYRKDGQSSPYQIAELFNDLAQNGLRAVPFKPATRGAQDRI
jgi:AcrR family transcriptional regulator